MEHVGHIGVIEAFEACYNASMHPDLMTFQSELNRQPTDSFLDSGSTISVMSMALANKLNLKPNTEFTVLVGHIGGTTRSVGRVSVLFKIGEIRETILVRVFPHLHLAFYWD